MASDVARRGVRVLMWSGRWVVRTPRIMRKSLQVAGKERELKYAGRRGDGGQKFVF